MSTVKTYNVDSGDATNLTLKTNGTTAVTVDSSQNVGIGTSSPQRKLHSYGGVSDNCILATSLAGNAYIGFADVGTTDQTGLSVRMGSAGNAMLFQTGGTTERMRITSNGGVSFGSSGTAYGSSGQVLVSNGDTTPTWGSSIVSGTAQATTSGTTKDFTGIPSWVKRVTVIFSGVSLSGTAHLLIQLGSGSVATSGYVALSNGFNNTGTAAVSSTSGFPLYDAVAAAAVSGNVIITLLGSNTWVQSHSTTIGASNTTACGGGNVTLGGTLDRVRITTTNGTDTFDAGSVNILYE